MGERGFFDRRHLEQKHATLRVDLQCVVNSVLGKSAGAGEDGSPEALLAQRKAF